MEVVTGLLTFLAVKVRVTVLNGQILHDLVRELSATNLGVCCSPYNSASALHVQLDTLH